MAVSADRVIVELEARIGKYRRDMEAAEKAGTKSFGKIGKDAKAAERQILQSSTAISGSLRNLAGSFAAAFSAREVVGLIDGYTRFTNQLKVAGLEGQELVKIQKDLIAVGNQYGVSIEELSRLYGGLSSLQKDLNTTSADTLNLTQAVAASIKISGVSSERAAGAILGLNQAFSQTRVQTDEYNQILDGARPLLQAAVNASDKYRGSLTKLKQDLEAGKVSGAELFRIIQAGTSVLFKQAELSTLTLAGAFQSLTDALTVYVGQASASNGTTAALAAGIKGLADNLDTLATALGVVGAVLLGRYAAGLIAGASANGVLAASIFAVQARALGAATSLEAMAFAGRAAGASLLTAFGGPVGLAITAITIALGVAVAKSLELSEAEKSLAAATQTAINVTKPFADAVDKLASAQGRARDAAIANAKALREEAIQAREAARGVALLAKVEALRLRGEAQKVERIAQTSTDFGVTAPGGTEASQRSREANASFRAAADTFNAINGEIKRLDKVLAVSVPAVGGGDASGKGKKGKGASGPSADQVADARAQAAADILRAGVDLQEAEADLTTDTRVLDEARRARIKAERDLAIQAIQSNKLSTDEQKAQAILLENKIAEARLRKINIDELQRTSEEAAASTAADRDLLEAAFSLVTNRQHRADLELQIIDLKFKELDDALRAQLAQAEIAGDLETQARINRQLSDNEVKRNIERAGSARDNESPLQRFRREVGDVGNNINDQLEKVQVDGLNALNDGLVDAITGAKSLGDVFNDIANSIIKDLLRIAIQQAIIGPLVGSGGGGGGFFGALLGAIPGVAGAAFGGGGASGGSFFKDLGFSRPGYQTPGFGDGINGKRASGGNVVGGGRYLVGENGPEIAEFGKSGKIYPTGSLKAQMSGGGTIVIAPQQFDLSGVVMTEDLIKALDSRNRAYADQVSQKAGDQALRGSGAYNDQQRKLRG